MRSPDETAASSTGDGDGPPGTEPARARLLVLIVEDHPDAGESLGEALALEGHAVVHAADARRGLAALAEVRPDVLVCDLGLPDLPGHELLRAAHAAGTAPPLAFSMSGYADPEDEARALDAGFAAHFQKPFPLDALRALLRSAAARAGRTGSR